MREARAPRVLVPHERFAPAMRAAGLDPAVAPLTRTVSLPVDPADVDPAGCAWVVVTSARTVRALRGHAWPAAVRAAQAGGTRVAAVGSATAAALADVGVTADLVSPDGTMAGIVASIGRRAGSGPDSGPDSVLIPASALADPAGPDALAAGGWRVRPVPVYGTAPTDRPEAVVAATAPWPDAIALTSPSNLHALLAIAGRPPAGCALVAIGPTTAEAIRSAGLTVTAEADEPTPGALAAAAAAATAVAGTATHPCTDPRTDTPTTRAAERATRAPGPGSGVGGRRRP